MLTPKLTPNQAKSRGPAPPPTFGCTTTRYITTSSLVSLTTRLPTGQVKQLPTRIIKKALCGRPGYANLTLFFF